MDKEYHQQYYHDNKKEMNERRLRSYYKRVYNLDNEEKVQFWKKHKKLIKSLKDLDNNQLELLHWFVKEWNTKT